MNTDISFDVSINRHHKHDPIERARSQIHFLEEENSMLERQIEEIETKPWNYIQDTQRVLKQKIEEIRNENEGIESLIDKSRMPGYAEMTKKKRRAITNSGIYGTPTGKDFTPLSSSRNYEVDNMMNSSFGMNSRIDQMDMNSEKGEASTCQNFPLEHSRPVDPIQCLRPLQQNELKARTRLTMQLLQVIDNAGEIENELQNMTEKQAKAGEKSILRQGENTLHTQKAKLQKISQYKKKLLSLLQKLKTREGSVQQITEEYRRMHEKTMKQLVQATEVLNGLQQAHVSDNLDSMFAEVVQLQEKLRYINEQLQRLDEGEWMKEIMHDLNTALKKLGLALPNVQGEENLRERIDQACQILIECVAHQKVDDRDRLILLKFYHQEEKENNKLIVKALQKKQQTLSKQLIDLQMVQ